MKFTADILNIIAIYLLFINILSFICYGIDKWKSKRHKWRISEATLLTLAALGGGLGAWLAMRLFRHKTKHWKFLILVPLFIAIWVAALIYFL